MSDSTRSGVGDPDAKELFTWDRNTVESDDSTSTVTWMFGFCFSKFLTCVSVYWPSLPRPEMANVIAWVAVADCCVVLELELHAAVRPSRAADATTIAARLVLVLALMVMTHSPDVVLV
jgi:hypothetical protein